MNKILLVMVMTMLSGPVVFAEMPGPGLGRGMGYGLGACGDAELNLSPDQASKVRVLQLNYLKKIRLLQRELMIKRAELRVMNSGPVEDTPRFNRQRLEIEELREKIREIWLNYKMECRALLTSEQLEQLGSMERRPSHRQGMGWGHR